MLGGADGFLKLIFHAETLKLLGVHAIGEGATEIIHIGQVVMSQGGTIEYFRSSVFNYPTLGTPAFACPLDCALLTLVSYTPPN
jgi:NAD(P) transhydrogenase